MANLVRNDLIIEGEDVKQVLDAIGFNPDGVPIVSGAQVQPENVAVLIDFDRIVPRPKDMPEEGWDRWFSENWGTTPYDGARPGDVFEVTDSKAHFKFYTRWTSAFPLIETLSKRFPEFRFHLRSWEMENQYSGEAAWENGQRTIYVPMFPLKLDGHGLLANDPITAEIKSAAGQMIQEAFEKYTAGAPGEESVRDAELVLAYVIAESGSYVVVEGEIRPRVDAKFEPNAGGTPCLVVEVHPVSEDLKATWALQETAEWNAEVAETERLSETLGMKFLLASQNGPVRFAVLPFAAATTNDPYRVIAPALRYKNADPVTGKYAKNPDGSVPPIEWEIQLLCLSRWDVEQIMTLPDEGQNPYDIDIVMTQAGGRALPYQFNRVSAAARWKANRELAQEVERKATEMSEAFAAKLAGKCGVAVFDDFQNACRKG
jgi:hypothetical protein